MGIRVPTPLAIVTALAMGPNGLAGIDNPSLTEPNPPSRGGAEHAFDRIV
jgi:hypothetical protein